MNDTPSLVVFRHSRTRTFCLFSEDLAFGALYVPQVPLQRWSCSWCSWKGLGTVDCTSHIAAGAEELRGAQGWVLHTLLAMVLDGCWGPSGLLLPFHPSAAV